MTPSGLQLLEAEDGQALVYEKNVFIEEVSKWQEYLQREGYRRLEARRRVLGFLVQEPALKGRFNRRTH